MEKFKIEAKKRESTGKEYAGKIRRQGLIPGILYKKGSSTPLEFEEIDLVHLFHKAHSENIVTEIEITDGDKKNVRTAILKDVDHDVIKGSIIHVDFQEISLEEVMKIKVPLEIKGEAIGVKRDGGVLDHLLWEVDIECKAEQIPEKLEVTVDDLEIGDAVHLSDLKVPEGVKLIGDLNRIVLHVAAPRAEVVEEEAPVEVAEGAQEPEVIKEKKTEEDSESQETKDKGSQAR